MNKPTPRQLFLCDSHEKWVGVSIRRNEQGLPEAGYMCPDCRYVRVDGEFDVPYCKYNIQPLLRGILNEKER